MEEILRFYEETAEAARLETGSGLLERVRTEEILARYLPAPPATILDVGGGPGIYAGWLAEKGYQVFLVDLVQKHIDQARRYPLAGCLLGDARALPCEDGFADSVLLMGPLYHLIGRADRIRALREAARALRPGGLLAATVITRFASLMHALVDGFVNDDLFWPILVGDLESGVHRNETGNAAYFTTAVFHKPGELQAEVEEAGFTGVRILAVEGPVWLAKEFDSCWQDEPRRARLLDLARRVESEPVLLGSSLHLIAIAKKEGPTP